MLIVRISEKISNRLLYNYLRRKQFEVISAAPSELTQYRLTNTERSAKFDAMARVYSFLNCLDDSAKKDIFEAIDAFKNARSGIFSKSAAEQEKLLQNLRVLISLKLRDVPTGRKIKDIRQLMDDFYSLIKNDSHFYKRGQTHSYQFLRRYALTNPEDLGQGGALERRLIKNIYSRNPDQQLLFILAANADKIKFPSSNQASVIADLILQDKFGDDPTILKALVISLGKMSFTAPVAQDKLLKAAENHKFGSDPEVLSELEKTLDKIKSLREKRAITIQNKFRSYKAKVDGKRSLVNFSSRKILMGHMKNLNHLIATSHTASIVNNEEFSYQFPLRPIEKLRFNQLVPYYKRLIRHEVAEPDSKLFAEFLKLGVKSKNLVCNSLAMVLAIKIRGDESLPKELRDQVYVCEVGGHVMCCIGDPNKDDSIILDPWVRYLNLSRHNGWRPTAVRWDSSERERGFMGPISQYKKFLTDHPNEYVPKDTPKNIVLCTDFTKLTRQITSEQLGLGEDVTDRSKLSRLK